MKDNQETSSSYNGLDKSLSYDELYDSMVETLSVLLCEGFVPILSSGEEISIPTEYVDNLAHVGTGMLGNISLLGEYEEYGYDSYVYGKRINMKPGSIAWYTIYSDLEVSDKRLYLCDDGKLLALAKERIWKNELKAEKLERLCRKALKRKASIAIYNELVNSGAPIWGAKAIVRDMGDFINKYIRWELSDDRCIFVWDLWTVWIWMGYRADNAKWERDRQEEQKQKMADRQPSVSPRFLTLPRSQANDKFLLSEVESY